MFGFTDGAAVLIRSLIREAELGAGSGLRMSIDLGHRSLAMGLADGPETADGVFTRFDVQVFVAPAAAARLRARTLDAQVTDDRPAFFLRDR